MWCLNVGVFFGFSWMDLAGCLSWWIAGLGGVDGLDVVDGLGVVCFWFVGLDLVCWLYTCWGGCVCCVCCVVVCFVCFVCFGLGA